jgi:hypothetical protein
MLAFAVICVSNAAPGAQSSKLDVEYTAQHSSSDYNVTLQSAGGGCLWLAPNRVFCFATRTV